MGGGKSESRYVFNSSVNVDEKSKVPSGIPKSRNSLRRSERRNLSVFYANAQSIMNKMCDLEVLASEQSPDIIAVTESWINSDIPDASVSLKGYTLFRKDRLDTKNGRGWAFYYTQRRNLELLHVIIRIYRMTFPLICGIKLERHTLEWYTDH